MITKEQVIEVLKKIYDPEIPVDIWELGLIYDIDIKGDDVTILMTVTAPNCPIAETLPVDVRNDVSKIEYIDMLDTLYDEIENKKERLDFLEIIGNENVFIDDEISHKHSPDPILL